MSELLTEIEARVIASLIEKSIVTPDQYPLTLNALTNACNQKTSRMPVLNLSQGEVQNAIRALEAKHLVRTEENFKNRTEKYSQRFCGTRYSDLQFNSAEIAVVCLLMLRGPQTPGELRARSSRLHEFADNAEVVAVLQGLVNRDSGAILVPLARTPGRKDAEYMHLLCGPIDVAEYRPAEPATGASSSAENLSAADMLRRIERLEEELAELRKRL